MKLREKTTNDWKLWFAWRPVWADDELVWLEKVWRRLYHAKIPNVYPSSWTIYMRNTQQNRNLIDK